MSTIEHNIDAIGRRLRDYETRYRRPPGCVRLLAVSKQQDLSRIRQAAAAGIGDFGENYLQEAAPKIEALAGLNLCWHFIGPLQGNKTRAVAALFDWVHSVDREKVARRLGEQRQGPPLNVCVQVRLGDEQRKSGAPLEQAASLCDCISRFPALVLRGLMVIPPQLADFEQQRHCFRRLGGEFQRLRERFPSMDTLSMGMSNDFEAAVAEGSTLVRLGVAIFGPRS